MAVAFLAPNKRARRDDRTKRNAPGTPARLEAGRFAEMTPRIGAERMQAEEALRASEARFRSLYEHAPIGMALLDIHGQILLVNPALQRILGYGEDALCRMTFADVTHPDDVTADWALFGEMVAGTRDAYTLDKRYLRKDGQIVWGQLAASVTRDRNGTPQSIIGLLLDVTERHTTEDRLRESEARYRRIVETAQEGIWQLDTAGTTTYVNRKMADMLGHTVEEMVGESAWTHLELDTHAQAREDLASQRHGTPLQTEARLRHRDGRTIRALIVSSPLFDPDGRFSGVLGMVSDITERTKAEAALRASEERYQQVERSTPIGLALQAPDGRYLRVNPALCALLGYSEAELLGRAFRDITHPDDLGADLDQARAMLAGETATYQTEERYIRKDGATVWVLLSVSLVRAEDGQPAYFIAQTQDISAQKAAEERLIAERDLLQTLIDAIPDAIYVEDEQLRFLRVNLAHAHLLGAATTEELLGKTDSDYFPPELARQFSEQERHLIATGEPIINDLEDQSSFNPKAQWILASKVPLRRGDKVVGLVGISRDITELKRAEDRLRHLALHDSLTNLPNRTLLHERIASAFGPGADPLRPLALLLLDLDHFKEINDAFGHHRGDVLLREAADRLLGVVRPGDTVARLGGDEFAVLLPGADKEEAGRVSAAIRATLDAPLTIDGQQLRVGASVGIALAPAHGTVGTTLLRRADMAMYAAKRGRLGQAFYELAHDLHSTASLARIAELREAIERGALVLHYQPQVELASGRVCGVEALVRWPHPVHGLIPPDQFIPLAEQTGLIAALTDWVLTEAIRQCKEWQRKGILLGVSVNLSMWNLHDPVLPERVTDLLRIHGLSAAWLRLELTESALMADTERTVDVLARLSALGLRLAVDDFGKGYSSLTYLKRLPVDELKIDKSFVRDMAADSTDAAIVAATVAMGHALGLRVVAEGVEDAATYTLLGRLGCDIVQGYYLSRPQSVEGLEAWLGTASLPSGRMLAHSS
ncbi:MAG: cph2 2 [Chloroflexi bacterium]|nr:cph2 2 [Chloroflexota bacterium]